MMPQAILLRFTPQQHQQSGGVALLLCHSDLFPRVCQAKAKAKATQSLQGGQAKSRLHHQAGCE